MLKYCLHSSVAGITLHCKLSICFVWCLAVKQTITFEKRLPMVQPMCQAPAAVRLTDSADRQLQSKQLPKHCTCSSSTYTYICNTATCTVTCHDGYVHCSSLLPFIPQLQHMQCYQHQQVHVYRGQSRGLLQVDVRQHSRERVATCGAQLPGLRRPGAYKPCRVLCQLHR